MKRFIFLSKIICVIVLAFFLVGKVFAQSGSEAITNFTSRIEVQNDNSVNVTETISYSTGPEEKHGIYRDIYPYSSDGSYMKIDNISVFDQNGIPYIWKIISSPPYIRIRIGDPDKPYTGSRVYVISYTAHHAVAHLSDKDEIYLNATGNTWTFPIMKSAATVILPSPLRASAISCYYGPTGSKNSCDNPKWDTSSPTVDFSSPSPLLPGEGLTVAVGFKKGILPAYTFADNFDQYARKNVGLALVIALPIIVFILMYIRWYKHGRDPKNSGVIVPQYDVPENLTPLEVAGIVRESVSANDISSELIYLATKGYIKIKEVDSKLLGVFSKKDYVLELTKSASELTNDFDKKLLEAIFVDTQTVGQVRNLSDLKNKFYINIPGIIESVRIDLLVKEYFSSIGKTRFKGIGPIVGTCLVFAILIAYVFQGVNTILFVNIVYLIISLLVTVGIVATFMFIMPARTTHGLELRDYLLGLKDYMQIAEKDRMKFANAPAKRPEIFENLLPYAICLGVYTAWAKEFEGIYTTPPSWYESSNNMNFSTFTFMSALNDLQHSTSATFASTPGGSGGGGFSGGGGGGGGGGSW